MYTVGSDFIQQVQQSQGWPGIDTVYLNPPQTTEQLLHPEKYFNGEIGAQVDPPDLNPILVDGWMPEFQGSLGEWKTLLLLTHQPITALNIESEDAEAAAAGWNGDFTQIFSQASGNKVIAQQWLWDSQTDQQEFENLLKTIAEAKIAGAEEDIQGIICNSNPGSVSCILSLDQQTVWMLSPDTETASNLITAYLSTE